jgi:anti-sigma regulatory factor (Ser/Thr protein kinase)
MELTLPARAESLAIVRDALRAVGNVLAIDEQQLADICLAVTEACTNVVLHAYPDGFEGSLDVTVWGCGPDIARAESNGNDGQRPDAEDEGAEEELTVVVGDCGQGTEEPTNTPGLGLGLRLISALSKSAHVTRNDDGRTEVEMTFALAATSDSSARSLSNTAPAPR